LAQARLFEQLAERNAALEERSGVIRDLVYALSHDLRNAARRARDDAATGSGPARYGELPERYREIVERSVIATDDVQRLAETLCWSRASRAETGARARYAGPRRDRAPDRGRTGGVGLTRHVALSTTIDAGAAVRTVGDRSDIRRAITNLVANALEHTRPMSRDDRGRTFGQHRDRAHHR